MRGIRRTFPAVVAVGAVAVAILLPRLLGGPRATPIELAAPALSTRTTVQAPLFPAPPRRQPRAGSPPQARTTPVVVRLAPSPQLATLIVRPAGSAAVSPRVARLTRPLTAPSRPAPAPVTPPAPAAAPAPAPAPDPAPAPAPAPTPAAAPTPAPQPQPAVRTLAAEVAPPVAVPVVAVPAPVVDEGENHQDEHGNGGQQGDQQQGDHHGGGQDGGHQGGDQPGGGNGD